jgi:glutamyl-tRNA synthetase
MGGTFILRVEDTDQERSTPEMTQGILDGLTWLGLDWDEGPFLQSERQTLYRQNALKLLASGRAYRCFCSREALEKRKNESPQPEAWKYDGHCRNLSRGDSDRLIDSGETPVIRFAVPDVSLGWKDLVKGSIEIHGRELEDFVLVRADGSPTYHLSVVTDDLAMGITHVIRGEDHISNTPKQIALARSLGADLPEFGHLPLILGPDRKKLSKRHGVTSVMVYQHEGILSLALFNILAHLGANLGEEGCLPEEVIQERFKLSNLKTSASVFDVEKLRWMNGQAMSHIRPSRLSDLMAPFLAKLWRENPPVPVPSSEAVLVMSSRAHTLPELAESLIPFLTLDYQLDPVGMEKRASDPKILDGVERLTECLREIPPSEWLPEPLEKVLREHADAEGLKAGALIHPVRLFLTGKTQSPGIFDVLHAMGREGTLVRLERGLGVARRKSA